MQAVRRYLKFSDHVARVLTTVQLLGKASAKDITDSLDGNISETGLWDYLAEAIKMGLLTQAGGSGKRGDPRMFSVVEGWQALYTKVYAKQAEFKEVQQRQRGIKMHVAAPSPITKWTGINSVFQLGQQNDQDTT